MGNGGDFNREICEIRERGKGNGLNRRIREPAFAFGFDAASPVFACGFGGAARIPLRIPPHPLFYP